MVHNCVPSPFLIEKKKMRNIYSEITNSNLRFFAMFSLELLNHTSYEVWFIVLKASTNRIN